MVAADFNVRLLMLGSKGWMAMKPSLIIVVMLKDTFNQHADDFIAYMTYI